MSYLSDNLKVLLWKSKGDFSQKSYSEYIDIVASQCNMSPNHFRAILRDKAKATKGRARRDINLFKFLINVPQSSALSVRFVRNEMPHSIARKYVCQKIRVIIDKTLTPF